MPRIERLLRVGVCLFEVDVEQHSPLLVFVVPEPKVNPGGTRLRSFRYTLVELFVLEVFLEPLDELFHWTIATLDVEVNSVTNLVNARGDPTHLSIEFGLP